MLSRIGSLVKLTSARLRSRDLSLCIDRAHFSVSSLLQYSIFDSGVVLLYILNLIPPLLAATLDHSQKYPTTDQAQSQGFDSTSQERIEYMTLSGRRRVVSYLLSNPLSVVI